MYAIRSYYDILDDGRRESFRRFAEEVGVGYLTRPDNCHAKAGNLNHALERIDGELVAIFDCDHVPVRSRITSYNVCYTKLLRQNG